MSEAREAPRGLAPSAWLLAAAGLTLAWHATSGPHPFDAGELVAAGARLGGSHPPGQPVHALLAHAATLLPLGSAPWRVALLSALSATVAAWLVGRIAGVTLEGLGPRRTLIARLAPDAAAVATLLAPPVLRQATRVEVYGLALALTAGAVLSLLRWGTARSGGGRHLLVGALLAGLTVGVHPPHALVPVVLGVLLAATLRRDLLRRPGLVVGAALACLIGLTALAYLPVRASAGAPMWGDPTDAAGLWAYLSGAAYRQNLGATGSSVGEHLLSGVRHSALAAGVVPLIGVAVLGARAHRSRAARGALIAVVAGLPCAWVIAIDPAIPDAVAYAGPAAVAIVAAGCAGLTVLAAERGRAAALAGLGALAVAAVHPLALAEVPSSVRQDAPVLETLGGALVDTPPPRSLVMVENDFEAATWMMAQAVDGARPDCALFVPGLATSSWHWRSLAGHPLFDGEPVRGPGADARAAYVEGAFRTAAGNVAVAVGPSPVRGPGSVAGPYRLLWPRDGAEHPPVWDRSVGERLALEIGREQARGPEGDRGDVGAVVRQHQASRARRLADRDRVDEALAELARATVSLPAAERRVIDGPAGPMRKPPPPVVSTPGAFLVTPDDAARTAAVVLWAAGQGERAQVLLRLQVERGVAPSALQVGWLRLADDDVAGAREAMRAAVAEDPALEAQAAALARAIEGRSS